MFYEPNPEELQESGSPPKPVEWNYSWQGLMGSIKQTSETLVQVLKEDIKDLAEIGEGIVKATGMDDSITSDASTAKAAEIKRFFGSAVGKLDDYATKAEQFTSKGISSLGTNIASGLNGLFLGDVPALDKASLENRTERLIYDAGVQEDTYLKPFANEAEEARYTTFAEHFDRIAHAGKIASLLDKQPKIKVLMDRLVPKIVSDEDFWIRYYFKVSELEMAQQTRAALLTETKADEEVGWSTDEEQDSSLNTTKAVKAEESTAPSLTVEKVVESDQSTEEQCGSNFDFLETKTNTIDTTSEKNEDDWGAWE